MNYCSFKKVIFKGSYIHAKKIIPPKVKLAATLRFLSPGVTYIDDLQHFFRVHKSCTMAKYIPQVYQTTYNQLKEEHLNSTHLSAVCKLCYFP